MSQAPPHSATSESIAHATRLPRDAGKVFCRSIVRSTRLPRDAGKVFRRSAIHATRLPRDAGKATSRSAIHATRLPRDASKATHGSAIRAPAPRTPRLVWCGLGLMRLRVFHAVCSVLGGLFLWVTHL